MEAKTEGLHVAKNYGEYNLVVLELALDREQHSYSE